MLHGVGGATIEEAKQRITYAEFQDWVRFRNMRGSLFTGNRLESGFALLAWIVQKGLGGTREMVDFMPHADRSAATLQDVIKEFGGVKGG